MSTVVDKQETLIDTLAEVLEPRMKRIAEQVIEEQEDLRSFSYKTVMNRLEVSEYVLNRMITEGKLEVVRPSEGTVRITARSLRKFLYGDRV